MDKECAMRFTGILKRLEDVEYELTRLHQADRRLEAIVDAAKERHLANARLLHELRIGARPLDPEQPQEREPREQKHESITEGIIPIPPRIDEGFARPLNAEEILARLSSILVPGSPSLSGTTIIEMVEILKSAHGLAWWKNPAFLRIQKIVMPDYSGPGQPTPDILADKVEMWVAMHQAVRKAMDQIVQTLGPRAALNPGENYANIVERVRELVRFKERTEEELSELDES